MDRTDALRAQGSDGGERVAVEVMDREHADWSGHIFGQVEKFGIDTPDLLIPKRDLIVATRSTKLDPRVLRPFLREDAYRLGDLSGDLLTALGVEIIDITEFKGNLLVNQGIQRTEDLLIAVSVQAYDNTHCRLGVGNSATAATATDTDLNAAAGSSNRQFVVMDSTFPSRASQTLSFKATHTTGLSNFHWQEWGLDNGVANGTTVTANFLNHKVTDLGTKTSAAAWAFTVTLVYS